MSRDASSKDYLELKTELRSLLISSQQGCNEQQLMRDYREYNGRNIPFHEMGYSSLIDLLKSMPDVARIDFTRTPLVIHGVPDENTVHIKKLVMAQRKKKNARNPRGGMNRINMNNRTNGPSTYSRYRQTPQNFVPNGISFQPYTQIRGIPSLFEFQHNRNQSLYQQDTTKSYLSSSVIINSNQNQIISTSNASNDVVMKKTSTRIVAEYPPKPSPRASPNSALLAGAGSTRDTPTIDDNSSIMDEDVTYTEDDELMAFDTQLAEKFGEKIILLRKRVRLLLLTYKSGVLLSSVHRLYQKNFSEELKLEDFGLKNLMAFFECVSDFVNSERDPSAESTNRHFSLNPKFVEAVKREQQADQIKSTSILSSDITDNQVASNTNQNSSNLHSNGVDQPLVDLSSFVPLDFQYEQMNYGSSGSFPGFLGAIENPWIIHIGNTQFLPKREDMMAQMQHHYNQMSNESIYLIPFEQITPNLSCVYHHDNDMYYRSSIIQVDPISNTDILVLKLYLVDFGIIIPNINYHTQSTNLKFLHKDFSTLPTEVYDCRLARIRPPPTSTNWHNDTQKFIYNFLQDRDFTVEIVGYENPFYFVHIWIEGNSINQLLVQHGFATESNDSRESRNESNSEIISNRNNNNAFEFTVEENDLKYFVISIDHAYYFVKHPFSRRPCLPCFELARLLNRNETYVAQLNLPREQEFPLMDTNRGLFNALSHLPGSSKCPHINRKPDQATIILYDLSAVRDHLRKIKFTEGDVIDAFGQEYDDYNKPGYWNEVKSSYIIKDNFPSYQEALYQRRDLFNLRNEQLVSLSKAYPDNSYQNDIQDVEQGLKVTNDTLHSLERIHSSTIHNHVTYSTSRRPTESTNSKMRETLYRIARPFDQQFSLNCRFNHHLITDETFNYINDDEIEERFKDLYRITKNVIDFFILESEMINDNDRLLISEVRSMLSNLTETRLSPIDRIGTYNSCLQLIEHFQPIIRYSLQRIDLMDTLY